MLTDEQGTAVGAEEVLRAHQDGGLLHRAFSIFVFNRRGETLLQRRSLAKRTFPALWSNACCGHPPPGDEVRLAAERRLLEELGFTVPLREIGTFAYRARDPESGLTEHEYDHVLVGWFGGRPAPDPAEASDWRWTRMEALRTDVTRTPGLYTPWLFSALETLGDAMEDPRSASP